MATVPTTPIRRVFAALWSHSRGERKWLVRGSVAGVVVVLARLALPFPLRNMAHSIHAGEEFSAGSSRILLIDGLDPYLSIGLSLLVLFALLGLSDFVQRLCFARFSIGTLRQARYVAIQSIRDRATALRGMRPGELVSRLIGDTARAKSGLKAFLVHVLTNSVLVIGVTTLLFAVNPTLALIFFGALVAVAALTGYGARTMYRDAHRLRQKEGVLANRVEKAWSGAYGDKSVARLNATSAKSEARLTRMEGICTWGAHLVLGLAIVVALLLGRREVTSNFLSSSDLHLFLLYAVLLRAPLVKIVSQGASTGKILACAERIVDLCDGRMPTRIALPPLLRRIRLEGVKVSTKKVHGIRRRRLGPIDLDFVAGEHVAVVGRASSGKSTLLRTLAGVESPRRGRVLWDDHDATRKSAIDRTAEVAWLPDVPSWPRVPVGRLLTIDHRGELAATADLTTLVGAFGAERTLLRRCVTWEAPLASADLSIAESKAIGLLRALRSSASVLLLDDPFSDMTEEEQQAALAAIRASRRTVVVGLRSGSPFVDSFDRVISLRRGRVKSDLRSDAAAAIATAPPSRPPPAE